MAKTSPGEPSQSGHAGADHAGYGDAATRDMGIKGTILPLIFVIAAALALTKGMMMALIAWPVGYIGWFTLRPKSSHAIVE